jgi:hypothetical protein
MKGRLLVVLDGEEYAEHSWIEEYSNVPAWHAHWATGEVLKLLKRPLTYKNKRENGQETPSLNNFDV